MELLDKDADVVLKIGTFYFYIYVYLLEHNFLKTGSLNNLSNIIVIYFIIFVSSTVNM